ncbi:hypothetical protein B5E84_05935 [Lachnoclostridium sp. An14]|uniref:BMP family ABC transporter substrate-binding protein n=1 Tax=Lachnoclostridium sp. An14 TaxID=1965562 RepID=UPI000B3989D6|nr:BMP family ABC transporter substrate-binding protein [Lachnoclostridium sp. An14]OUQ19776.1 hypothetical protein B5E84_05935 [Lachnoclostridium sp. An14]
MAVPEYAKARKLALKAYRQDLEDRKNPYLQVLDEILPFTDTVGEADLGLVEIPISRIAGTKTSGRTKAFAGNFMPLLPETSEFADKWSSLYQSHLSEGIREPVIACEFMNNYYIIEGNKRVSVMKFSDAVSIPGYVTRIIPAPGDSPDLKIYYEYMDFYRVSGINTIYFSKEGSFPKLCRLLGKDPQENWSREERQAFSSAFLRFGEIYREKGGGKLSITAGDGFLLYLGVYGWDGLLQKSMDQLRREIALLWPDLEAMGSGGTVRLVMQPAAPEKTSLIQKLIPPARPGRLKVGFVHYGTALTSDWTYAHDLGRLYLEDQMGTTLTTKVYDGIRTGDGSMAAIEQAVSEGCQVIFTTSPRFLNSSIRASIRYPEVKILNCSLNTYSGHLRTYYGRLYEAKFLVGMLAGILSGSGRIGYMADFPIFGTAASINAFALGVQMVDPEAKVYLSWSSLKGGGGEQTLKDAGVSLISGPDLLAPAHAPSPYGLYRTGEPGGISLASSIWHWGKFYHRILQTIVNGRWSRSLPVSDGDSINYWWGISSGIIDVICSKSIPARSRRLMELVKDQIVNGSFQIFSGALYDQEGILRSPGAAELSPAQIIHMDWLASNVMGRLPSPEELDTEAAQMMETQGIFPGKDGLL